MKTRETLKNLLIVVLLLGMSYLAVMTWMANNPKGDYFGLFSRDDAGAISDLELPDVDAYPLSVSICTADGRHSAVYDASAIEFAYGQTEDLLRKSIQSVKRGRTVEETAWRSAISTTPSVLYDYQCDVPMSVFSFWYGHEKPDVFSDYRVRYLCLAAVEDTVYLFGKSADGEERFSFVTEVSEKDLSEIIAVFHPNSYQLGITAKRLETPELLLSAEVPQVSELRVSSAAQTLDENGLDRLLRTFELNPNTVSRHIEQDGSRMFIEDTSTVKITSDGVVTYSDLRTDLEYNTGLTVQSEFETATVWEKAETARELVSSLDALTGSFGRLYLDRVWENGGTVEVLFRREVGGVPIDFGRDRAIARVVIQGDRVSEVEFVMRSYTTGATKCVILPSLFAAATESSAAGREPSLRYLDTAQETVRADWYVK